MSLVRSRRFAFASAVTLLAACGGGGSKTAITSATSVTQATVTTAAAATTVAPKGPATAEFTLTGDAGLAGPLTISGIRCNQPTLDGTVISFFGTPATAGLSMLITLSPDSVSVRLDTGSGATYLMRNFEGTGVTDLDPAVGAHVDSPLTPKAGETVPASLGVIASMKGSVDCGNQQPGTATISLTDPNSGGGFAPPLQRVRVECDTNAQGLSVQLFAIANIGSTPELVIVTIRADALSVAESGRTGLTHFYTSSSSPGSATLTASGAHADGDLAQQYPSGTTNTVHMTGDATCGTTVNQ